MGGGNSKVIEEWHEGTEWYRVWSDGFIEQGGEATASNNGLATITLHKPYSSTNYQACGLCYEDRDSATSITLKYPMKYPKTTNILYLKCVWAGGAEGYLVGKFGWMTRGY